MKSIIKAIIIAAVIEVITALSLCGYIYFDGRATAARYASIAEANAASYTDDVSLRYYNRIQQEQSAEREDLHEWIDRRIDLKLHEALHKK